MRGRILEKLARIRSRHVADVIIGFLLAVSDVWVDVNWFHRFLIGVTVSCAFEMIFSKIDERQEAETEEENVIDVIEIHERKERNRDHLYKQWEREMPQ